VSTVFARLEIVHGGTGQPDRMAALGVVAHRPGFAGGYLLEQLGVGRATLLTLWENDVTAGKPSAGNPGDSYHVHDDWSGRAATERPTAASVLYFDGPLSPARIAAGRRANRERLQPALRDQPGLVRVLSLWHPEERKVIVVALATSLATLEAASNTVNSTELLDGEDPALLTGPDRVDVHRVVDHATAHTHTEPQSIEETVS